MGRFKRHKRALYRIEFDGRVMPWGRFFSYEHALEHLRRELGKSFNMLQPFYKIIDDNGIPF